MTTEKPENTFAQNLLLRRLSNKKEDRPNHGLPRLGEKSAARIAAVARRVVRRLHRKEIAAKKAEARAKAQAQQSQLAAMFGGPEHAI